MQEFTKSSNEIFPVEVDFTDSLPTGETLSTGAVSAVDLATGLTDNTVLGSTTASISSPKASFIATGGTNGESFKIVLAVTTTPGGYVFQENILMTIDDNE